MNAKEYIYLCLGALFNTLKSSFIMGLTVFSAFVAPIGDLLFFVSTLIIVDFITGIVAAGYRGELRESKKMMRSVWKFGLYMMVMIMAHLFDQQTSTMFQSQLLAVFLSPDSMETISHFKLFAAISFIIVVRELKSVDENWGSIFSWSFTNTATLVYNASLKIIELVKTIKTKKDEV